METPNSSTINYLQNENGRGNLQAQFEEALTIANNKLGISDIITVSAVDMTLKGAEAQPNLSAKSYFDRKRLTEEFNTAKEMGLEKEAIGNEAGVHGQRFFIKPVSDTETLSSLVWEALRQSRVENIEGLLQIYIENKKDINYDFKDRTKIENLDHWRNLVASRLAGNKVAYKEWDNVMDKNGNVIPRNPKNTKDEDLYEVEVLENDDLFVDRKFSEIISGNRVAKVILFKNKEGKVDQVEVWTPHLTCDEIQTRGIENKIGKVFVDNGIELDNSRSLNSTTFLRMYSIVEGRENVDIFDVESSFKMSKEERDFHHIAALTLGISRPAYFASIWSLLNNEQSLYICVSPDKPRKGETNIASGLQFALLTRPASFDEFNKTFKKVNYDNPASVINDVVNSTRLRMDRFAPRLSSSFRKIALFTNEEIKKAKQALGTLSILGALLPDSSRQLFKRLFKAQNKIMSEGSFQVSSVDQSKELIQNSVFTTASNISTETVLAIKKGSDSLVCDLRFVTDKAIQDEVKERYKKKSINSLNIEDRMLMTKQIIEEKVKEFRRALLLTSVFVVDDDARATNKMSNDMLKNYDMFVKALNVVNQEN